MIGVIVVITNFVIGVKLWAAIIEAYAMIILTRGTSTVVRTEIIVTFVTRVVITQHLILIF